MIGNRTMPAQRDRRTLTGGAIVIATLVLLSRGIPASRSAFIESRALADDAMDQASRVRALLVARPAMRDTFAVRLARYVELAPKMFHGDTPAMAAASLASAVTSAAAEAGVKVGTMEHVADSAKCGALIRVSVRAQAEGDVRGVSRFLALVESGPELVAVRELTVTPVSVSSPDEVPEQLRLQITVEAPARVRAPVPGKKAGP